MTVPIKGGAPAKWKSPEELEAKLSGFFSWCDEMDYMPDIEALAEYLDTTRKTIYVYEQKPEFRNIIQKIKNKIFNRKKQAAYKGKIPAAIFIFDAKNNHGYRDRLDLEHGGKIKTPISIMPASIMSKKLAIDFEEAE